MTRLSPAQYLMRLGKSANRSSALHEMAHMFLFQMRDGARSDWLTAQGKEVWAGFKGYFRDHAAEVAAEANAIARRRGLDTVVTEDDVRAMIEGGMEPGGAEMFQSAPPVESDAFKAWFGDSKVVDEEGKPLVVYHGTNADFEAFDKKHLGKSTDARSAKKGFFFTDSRDVASQYAELSAEGNDLWRQVERLERAGKFDEAAQMTEDIEAGKFRAQEIVMPTYLAIKNPLVIDMKGKKYDAERDNISGMIADAKAGGYDGLFIKNFDDSVYKGRETVSDHYVVFEPTQIKSIHNRGTFDPNDPRILYQGESAPVAVLTGTELGDFGGDIKALRAAAKAFYKDRLQGTSALNPALGAIRIGSGRKTFSSSADPRKLKVFPALKDILSSARIVESKPPVDPSVEGATKAYHWLEADISLEGKAERVGLTVREDTNGAFYYNHTLDVKRGSNLPSEARSGPALKAGGGTTEGGETPLFQSIPESGDGVNIYILPQEGGREAGAAPEAPPAPPGSTQAQRLAYEGMHEIFARSFEGYLREGKAPSRRLRGAFRMFRRWLSAIYRSLKELRIELDPEISGLFDRMLAADAEIEARAGKAPFAPLPDSAMEVLGLSEEDRRTYRAAVAEAEGKAGDVALGAFMQSLDQETAQLWQDELASLKVGIRAAMRGERNWNALAVLTGADKGGERIKIDAAALKEGWPPEIVRALSKTRLRGREWIYAKEGGIDPDAAADLLGYESGDRMIRELAAMRPYEDEVSARADAEMKRLHPSGPDLESAEL